MLYSINSIDYVNQTNQTVVVAQMCDRCRSRAPRTVHPANVCLLGTINGGDEPQNGRQ